MKKFTILLFITISLFFLLQVNFSRASGDLLLNLFKAYSIYQQGRVLFGGDEVEKQIGRSVDRAVRRQYKIYKDRNTNLWINRIFERLVKKSPRKMDYLVTILDDENVNAMAVPGGYIYINRGLIELADSDDEIAGVLSHEIGHIIEKHSMKMAKKDIVLSSLVNIIARGNDSIENDIAIMKGLFMLQNSRENEKEADHWAVTISSQAGYNPRGMIVFLNKLLKREKEKNQEVLPWLSTHPTTESRISQVEEEISALDMHNPGKNKLMYLSFAELEKTRFMRKNLINNYAFQRKSFDKSEQNNRGEKAPAGSKSSSPPHRRCSISDRPAEPDHRESWEYDPQYIRTVNEPDSTGTAIVECRGDFVSTCLQSNFFRFDAGKKYAFTLYVRGSSDKRLKVVISLYDKNKKCLLENITLAEVSAEKAVTTATWQKIRNNFEFKGPPNSKELAKKISLARISFIITSSGKGTLLFYQPYFGEPPGEEKVNLINCGDFEKIDQPEDCNKYWNLPPEAAKLDQEKKFSGLASLKITGREIVSPAMRKLAEYRNSSRGIKIPGESVQLQTDYIKLTPETDYEFEIFTLASSDSDKIKVVFKLFDEKKNPVRLLGDFSRELEIYNFWQRHKFQFINYGLNEKMEIKNGSAPQYLKIVLLCQPAAGNNIWIDNVSLSFLERNAPVQPENKRQKLKQEININMID